MGIPLALPLASLVFLGAFIPLVGAVLDRRAGRHRGADREGLGLRADHVRTIIAVQQLEAHVLQPLVMGRAVSVHPLAVVLAIAAGGVLAGIVGALLAVPTVAVLNSAVRVLLADDPRLEEADLEAEVGPAIAGRTRRPRRRDGLEPALATQQIRRADAAAATLGFVGGLTGVDLLGGLRVPRTLGRDRRGRLVDRLRLHGPRPLPWHRPRRVG